MRGAVRLKSNRKDEHKGLKSFYQINQTNLVSNEVSYCLIQGCQSESEIQNPTIRGILDYFMAINPNLKSEKIPINKSKNPIKKNISLPFF